MVRAHSYSMRRIFFHFYCRALSGASRRNDLGCAALLLPRNGVHQTIAASEEVNKTILEMLRFLLVGGVSFIVDFGFLIVFQEFVFKTMANGVLISAALSFLISLIVHYFLAVFWAFRNHRVATSTDHVIAGSLFILTNAVGLGINEFAMWIGVSLLAYHYILVKLLATVVVMFWNYTCQKRFIFKKEFVNDK